MKRLRISRLSIYIEPRDIWVGVYVAPTAIYVCPLPMLVLRWDRGALIRARKRAAAYRERRKVRP